MEWSGPNYIFGISTFDSRLIILYGERYMPNRDGNGFVYFSSSDGDVRPFDRLVNIDEWFLFASNGWGSWYHGISVQTWKAFAICVLLLLRRPLGSAESMLWSRWWAECNRRKEGLCRICGYDLRATPDRCPECGTVTAKP